MAVVTPKQRPIEDDLKNENGQIVVSSRMVAERFGKEHSDVTKAIKSLIEGVGKSSDTLFIPN